MDNWINDIVQMVTPLTNQPIVVIDPQKFLSIGEIQDRLGILSFHLVFAEQGIPARMAYETECRKKSQVILIVQDKWNPLPDIRCNALSGHFLDNSISFFGVISLDILRNSYRIRSLTPR